MFLQVPPAREHLFGGEATDAKLRWGLKGVWNLQKFSPCEQIFAPILDHINVRIFYGKKKKVGIFRKILIVLGGSLSKSLGGGSRLASCFFDEKFAQQIASKIQIPT